MLEPRLTSEDYGRKVSMFAIYWNTSMVLSDVTEVNAKDCNPLV